MTLLHGDCLDILPTIPDRSVDAVIADPPFGTTKCKWDSVIPFEPMWRELKRVIKPGGAIVLFGGEPFSSGLRMSNIKEYKYDWVWDKVTARGHLVAKIRPMQQTECISVFGKGKINYYPQMIPRPPNKIEKRNKTEYKRTEIMGGKKKVDLNNKETTVYDKWYPKNIIVVSNAGSSVTSVHPTQKPTTLLEYLIRTYTNEGETVLDFAIGSGSTGIAAVNTGREFIGIELDKGYYAIACDCIAAAQAESETVIKENASGKV